MRLIHCADLHLDSSMETHMSGSQASTRNTEIIHSFIRLTEYAQKNHVRAVLIAGDMFDNHRVKSRTVDEILDTMRRTPTVDYLYLAGNHDDAPHIFSDKDIPDNFHRFTKEWTTFRYDDVAISGIEMADCNAASLYQQVPHIDGCTNIVMLHGQVGTECGTDKVNLNLLRNKGIDYLALGHIHSYQHEMLDKKGTYCYSGCLEGRGFDECGKKGFVLIETAAKKLSAEFVPFACRTLHRESIDITGLFKNSEIAERMRLQTKAIPKEDMVEFILTGAVSPTASIDIVYLNNLIKQDFFFTKVKDISKMAVDPEQYKNDISLKGEYIRQILASGYPDEDQSVLIKIGLAALSGEEITL